MKAIILAGGEGSRLRPLTCDIPKPMARLCGKPILEYIMELLISHGSDEAYITLKYLGDRIENHFENGKYKSLKLNFVYEDSPLGTAGAAKNAVGDIVHASENESEPFIVISGDAMCDFNLTEAYEFHRTHNADATMLVYSVNDPREFGLVSSDSDGRVRGFIEKPGWGQAVTNKANTGIYIINRKVFDMIPSEKKFDFAKDLFPKMLENGMKLYSYETKGYWCDIGDLNGYVNCQRDMLKGKIKCKMMPMLAEGIYVKSKMPEGDYTVDPPVYIGENVSIGNGSKIGPYTVIDDGCTIGDYSNVKASVLLKNVLTGKNTSLTGAVMCNGSSVKDGASMFEGAVAGAGAIIGKNAAVNPRVLIWNGKSIEDGALATSNVKYGELKRSLFDDGGICGSCGIELSAELCARLGSAIGSSECGRRTGIACVGSAESKAMKNALMSGLTLTGAGVWDFGNCFESQLSYFTAFCGLESGIFVYGNTIRVFGWGGLPLPRYMERSIESSFEKGEFLRCSSDEYKNPTDMRGLNAMYRQELLKEAIDGITDMPVSVKSSNKRAASVLSDCIERLGGKISDSGTIFHLSRSGRSLTVFDGESGFVSCDKLMAICCLNEFAKGNNVSVPFDAPQVINDMAARFGKVPLRYLSSPADKSDMEARKLSIKQPWLRDGIFMAIKILGIIKKTGLTIKELVDVLPRYSVSSLTMKLNMPVSELGGVLGTDGKLNGEGIVIKNNGGRIMIRPSRSGKNIKVIAEAAEMEAAKELCVSAARKIREKNVK